MIAVAVGIMCLLLTLSSVFAKKNVELGRWRIPFALALALSIGWVFYLALSHHL